MHRCYYDVSFPDVAKHVLAAASMDNSVFNKVDVRPVELPSAIQVKSLKVNQTKDGEFDMDVFIQEEMKIESEGAKII